MTLKKLPADMQKKLKAYFKRPNFYVNGHPSVWYEDEEGERVELDRKIANLIIEMNKAGLVTHSSCQGGKEIYEMVDGAVREDDFEAYISIDMDNIRDVEVTKKLLIIRWNPPWRNTDNQVKRSKN